ncbi:hypothetical protein BJ508DRAFT_304703 [Ascobolus immersus RN42]|uniref:Heterokaryon incompatibility domain-containing protein n=1 Tax=Ascobolus immersus RN42 TaxID=1160509 RepID=A0A3N4IDH0_ASCIM|nr:hypothetical protein BJ508DRAFT_304703 [Ascobolus immersus RN42]
MPLLSTLLWSFGLLERNPQRRSERESIDAFLFEPHIWLGGFEFHQGFSNSTPPITLDEYLRHIYASRLLRSATSQTTRSKANQTTLPARIPPQYIQAMFTFGFLQAVTRRVYPESILIRRKSGNRLYVSDDGLRTLLPEWESRLKRLVLDQPDAARKEFTHIKRVIDEMEEKLHHGSWCSSFEPGVEVNGQTMTRASNVSIFLAVSVLLEAVKEVVSRTFPTVYGTIEPNGEYWTDGIVRHLEIKKMEFSSNDPSSMTVKGWCPYTINKLTETPALYTFARIRAPFIRTSRTLFDANRNPIVIKHKQHSCTPSKCMVNDMEELSKQSGGSQFGPTNRFEDVRWAQHSCTRATSEADCTIRNATVKDQFPFLREDHEQTFYARFQALMHGPAKLQPGGFPVIKNSGTFGFYAADSTNQPYVAISHVWADGFGSVAEDGLPFCTVDWIQKLVYQHFEDPLSGGWWMDSLNIPEEKKLRKRCIKTMRHVYERAEAVIVIDRQVMSIDLETTAMEDQLFAILTCGWMQRLWTLQEGILAKKLYFVFKNDMQKSLEDYYYEADRITGRTLVNPFLRDCKLGTLEIFQQYHKTKQIDIRQVSELLWNRTTSKLDDETIAVAGLLQVDTAALVEIDSSSQVNGKCHKELADAAAECAQQRLARFFLALKRLPSDIIFLQHADVTGHLDRDKSLRITTPEHFTWAPKSLLQLHSQPRFRDTTLSAKCTPDGLLVEYPIVLFENTVQLRPGEDLLVKMVEINISLLVTADRHDSEGVNCCIACKCRAVSCHALVCRRNPLDYKAVLAEGRNISYLRVDGILVELPSGNQPRGMSCDDGQERLVAHYLGAVSWGPVGITEQHKKARTVVRKVVVGRFGMAGGAVSKLLLK